MVSASKMRHDLIRLEGGKEFAHGSIEKMFKSDSYLTRKMQGVTFNGKECIVPITSDKGLCGAINSGIIREIKQKINHAQNKNLYNIVTIGEKGTSALIRAFPDLLKMSISEVSTPLNYSTVSAIASRLSTQAAGSDKIVIYYNEFKSAIKSEVRQVELFSREKFLDIMKSLKLYNQDYPDKWTANPALFELYISSNLYQAYLNNIASEQSSRMAAMENASKNAKELVEKLKLEYNKARQARITMELVEIISGAAAV
jgi:F-type H+-transporting ATPase subunit gamma